MNSACAMWFLLRLEWGTGTCCPDPPASNRRRAARRPSRDLAWPPGPAQGSGPASACCLMLAGLGRDHAGEVTRQVTDVGQVAEQRLGFGADGLRSSEVSHGPPLYPPAA